MSVLTELQKWYESQCDGDWEPQYGIRIDTLDNPGWTVTIDLKNTELERKAFQIVENIESEMGWVRYWVEGDKFNGVCGPQKLEEILRIFLNWTQQEEGFAGPDAV